MQSTPPPAGVDYRPLRTDIPTNREPYGVERNQLNDTTIPDLETKARLDLAAKLRYQNGTR